MRATICLLLLITAVVAGAATPEDDAKALFERYNAAWRARDADAMARLVAPDCVIIMTEPGAGAKRTRFFPRDSYIKLVRERVAQLADSTTDQTLHAVSAADRGDIFVIGEAEEHAQLHGRGEVFRYSFYAVARPVSGRMLFRFIVSQLTFYAPSPAPPK
ncbi:MAG: hypothetical protein QOH88_3229 [Verrucomicrobiota bacterium]|jgi:uncharacterized protein (TIGR02246 family)